MKQDTKNKIEAYKASLPGLRERVIAVALMLAISVAMMTSASYAWLTISKSPEVAGVTTNVTANGNLEIALVNPNGSKPGESQVGDSVAADGQTIVGSNITWGNLINLSDPSYGLDNIVLRPALLSGATNLLEQPLKGADYGEDGRVELFYNEDFQFVNWVEPANGLDGYFTFYNTPQYGVRAISTVKYEYRNNAYYQFTVLMGQAKGKYDSVGNSYQAMIGNENYINALAGLIGVFMTDKLNDSDTDVKQYIDDIYFLMLEFDSIVDDYAEVLVALANVQVYNHYGSEDYTAHLYDWDVLSTATTEELKADGVSLESLAKYKTIAANVKSILYGTDGDAEIVDCIKDLYLRTAADASASVMMSELQPYINAMVDIASCQIFLEDGTMYTVGGLGMSAATQLLGKDVDAKIAKGALKDFEQLTGYKMCATNVEVQAKYMITVTMVAKTITTTATDPYTYDNDRDKIYDVANSNKGDYTAVAEDTYGMAIDFWVRTNASDEYLILEGNVLTKTENVRATGKDQNGNPVDLWTVTITTEYEDEEGKIQKAYESIAVYKVTEQDESGNDVEVWRKAINHSLLYNEDGSVPEGQEISTPVERYDEKVTVIGYEGENRVWTENQQMDVSSTTQGTGSCYIFYADDPTQQANCLRLLSNLRVAFIDSNEDSDTYGRMIGIARLDIENRYEENGKVILPLVLMDDGSSFLTKYMGQLAVMPLVKNEATRLTAVVFLDGRNMSNADVLAANDIQGQLNIQFGTINPLTAQGNDELENATRSVSLVASANNIFPADNGTAITFSYDEAERFTVNVRLQVNGEQPKNATAFFMRKVNSTQGSREESFKLTQGEDGYWYGSYTFTAPGEYVLRTVQLDGVDYNLPANNYPSVIIEGFTVKSVSLYHAGNAITDDSTIMTDSNTLTANLSMSLASDKKLPSTVRLVFVKDDNTQVTANMTPGTAGTWNGNATFTTSGTYTLRYVVMDGEFTELAEDFQHTLTIYAGMKVRIRDTGDYNLVTWEGKSLTAPVYVEIMDDTDEEMRYLSGVKLYYALNGSVTTGINTDLKWNDAEDCYMGNLLIKSPGIFTFYSVDIGTSILRNTTEEAPSYTIISPDPPEYVGADYMKDMDYVLSNKNNDIYVGVEIAHADAATVKAILYNAETGKEHDVTGVRLTGTDVFLFALPSDTNGDNPKYQAGEWTIIGLELANVCDDNQNFYGEDNPMIWDLSADSDFWGNKTPDDLHVKVVTPVITLSGTDEDLDGGEFMGSATTQNSIVVTITDHNGERLDANYVSISDPKLSYIYTNKSSEHYGGYTSNNESNLGKIDDNDNDDDNDLNSSSTDGMTFTFNKITLSYAGEYQADKLTFSITIGDTEVPYEYISEERKSTDLSLPVLDMPKYTLTTKAPTVLITEISNHANASGFTSSKNAEGTKATVYYGYSVESACGGLKYDNYNQPYVVIKLTGIGAADSARLAFTTSNGDEEVHLYVKKDTAASVDAYEWTTDGECTRYVGFWESKTGNDEIAPAGTLTAEVLVLVDNGQEYTFDITDIVIENPQKQK